MISYQKLAEKLVSAKLPKEVKDLINLYPVKANVNLALALKEVCWEAWTKEPVIAQKTSFALLLLSKINSDKKISAISSWVSGISELTEGKLESAVDKIDLAQEKFLETNDEHLAAQTQVSKLYLLALLGRYDHAVECGKRALKVFLKFNDEIEAGKIENNLGNIVSRQELHEQAIIYYKSARNRFIKVGEYQQLVMSENGLAITYSALNDFRRAETVYQKALQHSKKLKMNLRQAEIEASIGNLCLFRGKFDKALKFFERSRQKYEQLKMPHQVATSELEIADAYLELNLNREAFEIYERITKSFVELKMQGEEARSRANFGRAAILLDKSKAARDELRKAAKLYIAENNLVGAAAVKVSEAQLEITVKNFKRALKIISEALELLGKTTNTRHKLTVNWLKSECLINLGEFEVAKNLLFETFEAATKLENGQVAQATQISLGKLESLENNSEAAVTHFKKAVELIENLRDPLPAEEFRMAFLANKLVPYQELAKICLQKNRLGEAFQYVEYSRSRALAENIGFEKMASKDDKRSTKLVKQTEDLREELNWFYSRMNRAVESEIESLQIEVKKREIAITEVQRKLNNSRSYGHKKQNSLDLPKLQKQLGNEQVLVEYVNFDGYISAFVITDKKNEYIENIAKEADITMFLEGLHFQFGALRYGTNTLKEFIPELKKRTDFYLQKLYETLVKPLESCIANKRLIVSPVGKLNYVPFCALYDGKEYLIEKREVSTIPSAKVLQICLLKPTAKCESALLIGYSDDKIPQVNDEIKTLSKIFTKSVEFTDQKATFVNFKKHAEKSDVLHIACHGEFRQDNPMFSSLRLADGWITVRDACAMELNAPLVTLSACETGLNLVFDGEELLGLSRGFLTAGARSLLLSLWNVNDNATQKLMKTFYEETHSGKSLSESLQLAQIKFIKQNKHPYFWSPFVLIGKS